MRQVPFGPDCGWHEPQRWLCQIRLTCADWTCRYGVEFVEDPALPRNFGALVEIDNQLFLLEAVPDSLSPMTVVSVSASANGRTPARAIESVSAAFECTAEQVEAVSPDLSEWPWALTCNDGNDGSEVHAYLIEEDRARSADGLRQRYPARDYRVEPAA